LLRLVFSILIVFAFLGCSGKHGTFNADFEKYVESDFNKTQAPNYVKDAIGEVIDKNATIDIDNPKRLSSVLNSLSQIDGHLYVLDDASEDIFLKSVKKSFQLGINSFDKLNQYIQDTSNYFIYIKKNRFLKNRVRVISVKDKDSLKKNLQDIPFVVNGKMAVSEILEQLREVSGFNIIAKNMPDSQKRKNEIKPNDKLFGANSIDVMFNNSYISFAGNNVMDLLNYISISFNVYVDVDYDNKIVIFQKHKTKIFTISINNVEYSGSLDIEKSVKNDVGSDDSKKSVKTKIEFDMLDSLKVGLEEILDKSGDEENTLFFNKTVGTVFVRADKRSMQDISALIDNFNNIFNKQIDFQLEVYEFAVQKDFNYGIRLGGEINGADLEASGESGPSVAQSIFNWTKTNAKDEKTSFGVRSDHTMVRLLSQSRYGYILKNSIPYYVDFTTSQNYVKTIETKEEGTGTEKTTKITPSIETTSEGTILSILAKINGNKIEFNLQPKIVSVDATLTQDFGSDDEQQTITLPKVNLNTFSSNIILKDGEKRIVGYMTSYEDSNNYNGMIPVENFVIGGSSTRKFIRKETVFVVSATIRE
jgi:hypothetical protein